MFSIYRTTGSHLHPVITRFQT